MRRYERHASVTVTPRNGVSSCGRALARSYNLKLIQGVTNPPGVCNPLPQTHSSGACERDPSGNLCEADGRYLSLYRGLVPVPEARHRPWREEAAEIAGKHGITVEQLLSRSRLKRITRPRQELMWRMYSSRRLSSVRIGQILGGLDHTTVLYGVRKHQARIDAGEVQP